MTFKRLLAVCFVMIEYYFIWTYYSDCYTC